MTMLWILLALGAALFSAISAIIGKRIMQHEHALEYGALKSSFGLLLIFAFPFIQLDFPLRTFLAIYGVSLIVSFGNLYYLKSIRHGDLSSITPLMNISPIFLLFIAYILLGEQVNTLALLGVFLLIVGTYVLQIGASKVKNFFAPFQSIIRSKYALYMMLAMVVYSLSAVLEKGILNGGVKALSLAIIIRFMISVNFLIFDFIRFGKDKLFADIRHDGKLAFFASASDILMILLQYIALSIPGVMVSLVIPLKRTSTLFTTIAGGRLFHEKHLGMKIFACFIMLAGVVAIAIS